MKPSSFRSIVVALTVFLFLMVNFIWPDGKYRKQMIDGDGRGYYDYLPTLINQKTVDFKQTFEHEKAIQPLAYTGHNFHKIKGIYINKFPIGTALMMLPFYLVAQVISPWLGLPANGYSLLYQYAVAIAALWWLWVGIFFLRKLLKSYYVSEKTILLSVLILLLGTNLFHYAFDEVAFSHVYSFSTITAFLFFLRFAFLKTERRYARFSAFLLGLIVLIRPVNGLVVFAIPILAGNSKIFKQGIIRQFGSIKNILILFSLFLAGILPQLVVNLLQTGSPFVYGYIGEGFYFLHPHLIEFLFGFKKGWFVYTPIMLLIFPAVVFLWRYSRFVSYSFSFFFIILIYVFSSWWNWYYGDGFGMRPMVEYYGLFVLIIALWFDKQILVVKGVVLLIVLFFSILNVVQTYQYSKGIVDVDSMTQEAYKYVFLRTSYKYRHVIGSADESFYGELSKKPLLESVNTFETKPEGWTKSHHTIIKKIDSLEYCFLFNDKTPYSTSYRFVVNDEDWQKRLYLTLKLSYFEPSENAAIEALYVVDVRDSINELKYYKPFKIKRLPDKVINRWRKSHIGLVLPELVKGDRVKVYCWNKALSMFCIDDYTVQLYEPKFN